MPKKATTKITDTTKEQSKQLGAEDVARYFELEHEIARLAKEYDALKTRIKEEIPEGNWPVADFEVKRWDQIGRLKTELFQVDFPAEQYPDMYSDVPDLNVLLKLYPPQKKPELYNKKPSPEAIKETLNKAEKLTYFTQVPYLKITKI